jgi:5'-deoxynucleotidase YfbR-like HD superfamily hydrolase
MRFGFSIDELSILSYLKRWQNVVTLQTETVAAHTAQVALITIKLHDYLTFDLGKALTIAALHDCQEVMLTDLPYNVTQQFPALAQAKREAESQINSARLPEYKDWLEQKSLEHSVVKLADTLQVCQFAKSELRIAYTERMAEVLRGAELIANMLSDELGFVLPEDLFS